MKPVFHWDVVQGSEEWLDLRSGRITASVAKTFLVNGKGENGFGAGAITEMYRLIEERLTGTARISFGGNSSTDWGHENEVKAVELYQQLTFRTVSFVGFVERDEFTGASPDGLIPELKKGLEVKCYPKEHLELVVNKKFLDKDRIQCQYNMWCTGYKEWDLIYYHPNLPSKAQYIIFNFKADKQLFKKFDERTKTFMEMVMKEVKRLS